MACKVNNDRELEVVPTWCHANTTRICWPLKLLSPVSYFVGNTSNNELIVANWHHHHSFEVLNFKKIEADEHGNIFCLHDVTVILFSTQLISGMLWQSMLRGFKYKALIRSQITDHTTLNHFWRQLPSLFHVPSCQPWLSSPFTKHTLVVRKSLISLHIYGPALQHF